MNRSNTKTMVFRGYAILGGRDYIKGSFRVSFGDSCRVSLGFHLGFHLGFL